MDKNVELNLNGKACKLPVVEGSEKELAIDISALRHETGYITLDDGYANTGSCLSKITFIDGEQGILRYRGIPIEELAEKSTFIEVAHLIIFGKLPTSAELRQFSDLLTDNELLHEGMRHHFEGFPPNAHPMAILSSMINAASCYYPELLSSEMRQHFVVQAARLLSQVRTIAAFAYRKSRGLPFVYPKPEYKYTANFLHMMFSEPYKDYVAEPEIAKALNLLLLLHADHEQNCSTSTVRMVGSSEVNIYAAIAAGINALWGPLHGGANQSVIEMLAQIQADGGNVARYVARAKDPKDPFRLSGFGHRVYKNYDPRARILKEACDDVLTELGRRDHLLDLAIELEGVALSDDYFIERKLYPNVDFYSGIILQAIGFPTAMFTVLFAVARSVGWVAQWNEMIEDPSQRIGRPRQLFTGSTARRFLPLAKRG